LREDDDVLLRRVLVKAFECGADVLSEDNHFGTGILTAVFLVIKRAFVLFGQAV